MSPTANVFNLKNKFLPKNNGDIPIKVGVKSLLETMEIIRNLLSETSIQDAEEVLETHKVELAAMCGKCNARAKLTEKIIKYLEKYEIEVPDMNHTQVAEYIYRKSWGLSVIEDVYNNPEVDEVEIIGIYVVYSIRKGVYVRENIRFDSEDDLLALIKRLIRTDRVDLTERTPVVRSTREDGSRVVITGPPITKHYTVTLRKHGTFIISREALIQNGTMDGLSYDKLALFSSGRLNILVSGPVNAGKTTLIRNLFKYGHPEHRTIVIEIDSELRLLEHYPGWNIIELEEQPKIGIVIDNLFETALQLSPVRIIIGEILGMRELQCAIKAGIRGQTGNFSTYHSKDINQALFNLALTYAEGSHSSVMTIELALRWVVQAFDVIIQLHTDPDRGVKKVVHVAEPVIDERGNLKLHDIAVWHGSEHDYCQGYWQHYPISDTLKLKLHRNGIPAEKLRLLDKMGDGGVIGNLEFN